jgi:hypothetical protein
VEVSHEKEWGTVCDDAWGDSDARAVCWQLGLSGGSARSEAFRGQGTGTIWMNRVECSGGETENQACSFSGWGNHNCVYLEDASVCCDWGDVCPENAKLAVLSWWGQGATSENCICLNEFFGSVSRGGGLPRVSVRLTHK